MPIIFNLAYRLLENGQRVVPGSLYNTAAQMAPTLKLAGFDGVQFFPFTVSQSGTASNGDGYGKQYDYKLAPSRFGKTEDELLRSIACLNAVGLDAGSDEVIHQYDGGDWSNPTKKDPYPEPMFPKKAWCFVGAPPRSPVDPVYDSQGNFGFGDMVSYINSGHDDYMLKGTIAAALYRAKRVGNRFYRLDDTKGEALATSWQMINAFKNAGLYGYGECFTGNMQELEYWDGQMRGLAGTLDFPLHWALVNACNGFNANALAGQGLCLQNDAIAWKFRDNGDTDTSPGQAVISNGLLATIRLLTAPGNNAFVYGKDWIPASQGGYGLAEWLLNQVWIAKNLAFGPEIQRWGNDEKVAVFERQGFPGLLTALNFDTYNTRAITVQTNFGPGVQLHDYTGKHSDIWTDGNGKASFTLPSNAFANGRSYLCFSRTNYSQSFQFARRSTTQHVVGNAYLDTKPATTKGTPAGSFWCDKDSAVDLNKLSGDGVRFTLTDATGDTILDRGEWSGRTKERGWHQLTAFAGSSAASENYEAAVTYLGTPGLAAAEL